MAGDFVSGRQRIDSEMVLVELEEQIRAYWRTNREAKRKGQPLVAISTAHYLRLLLFIRRCGKWGYPPEQAWSALEGIPA